MFKAVAKALKPVELVDEPDDVYDIGERVIFIPYINNSGQYAPGDKLAGTVIARFMNGTSLTYRLRLDLVYNDRAGSNRSGNPIIVGNITSRWIRHKA
jgi:hypothetical protein